MAEFLERIGIFPRPPDPRPLREIEADVDEELRFHLDASAQALADEGLDGDAARAEALRRFGDVDQVRRACVRTTLGERLVLQRIQFVLIAALLAAVVFLLVSNRAATAQAQAAAERARTLALMAELQARLAVENADVARLRAAAVGPEGPAVDREASPGEYLAADGRSLALADATRSWFDAFEERRGAWRHGLRVAERLAALPGSQGAEILKEVWPRLSVEHREQILKPFVFDGGSPHALEVLELGFEDEETSVKERAVHYLHTYAWRNLWQGDGAGEAWFAEWRDRPVAETLRENAARWAREYGEIGLRHDALPAELAGPLLERAEHVRPETFARAGVDLRRILADAGVCAIGPERMTNLAPAHRSVAERVHGWCQP